MASVALPSSKFYRLLRGSFPIETRITNEFGRGLYAKESIKMGHTVLLEDPLFTSLSPTNKITDVGSFSTETDFRMAKLVADAIEVARNSGVALDPMEMEEMHELAGHLFTPASVGVTAQNIYIRVSGVCNHADWNWDIFKRLYHAIMSYAQNGNLYLVKSMINHSCLANVVPRGEALIALVDIPEGEQIFTTYGPPGKWMQSFNIDCVIADEPTRAPKRIPRLHCNCMRGHDNELRFGKARDVNMVRELMSMNMLIKSIKPSRSDKVDAVWALLSDAYSELQVLGLDPAAALKNREAWLNTWENHERTMEI